MAWYATVPMPRARGARVLHAHLRDLVAPVAHAVLRARDRVALDRDRAGLDLEEARALLGEGALALDRQAALDYSRRIEAAGFDSIYVEGLTNPAHKWESDKAYMEKYDHPLWKRNSEAAKDAGLEVDAFGPRLSFFFNAHNNLFEEVAKFRAARRMWANITKELGATDPRAQMLRFHTQTGGSTLTAQQPMNNISRVTIQALAAALGGTQSLHTNGFDEALSLPTAEAASLALRTQQIVAFESGVTQTVDPLGGSFFVEQLTDEVEKAALNYIQRIDEMGGSVEAIEQGYIQNEIADSAYRYQREIESGEKIIVGVNKFTVKENNTPTAFKIDDSIRNVQSEKLKSLRAKRDNKKVEELLMKIKSTAFTNENLMPHVIEAVEAYATLGEIAHTLRSVFGEYGK